MYKIIKHLDGTISGQFQLQDGAEYYKFSSVEEGIEKAKLFAKTMNWTTIKKKDITFLQEKSVATSTLVEWKP